MTLAPVPQPTFQPPTVQSFYARDTMRQFNPYTVARYGVGTAAATEQQLAQNALAQKPPYQPPAPPQFPGQAGGAGGGALQQRQFGGQ